MTKDIYSYNIKFTSIKIGMKVAERVLVLRKHRVRPFTSADNVCLRQYKQADTLHLMTQLWELRAHIYWNHRNAAPEGRITFSNAAVGFFLSSSHFRSLQIWWPVLRFLQLLHSSQFNLLLHGSHMPHLFLFFFPEWMAEARSFCKGYSTRPAIWSALSAMNIPAGVIIKTPGFNGMPLMKGRSTGLLIASAADTTSMSEIPASRSLERKICSGSTCFWRSVEGMMCTSLCASDEFSSDLSDLSSMWETLLCFEVELFWRTVESFPFTKIPPFCSCPFIELPLPNVEKRVEERGFFKTLFIGSFIIPLLLRFSKSAVSSSSLRTSFSVFGVICCSVSWLALDIIKDSAVFLFSQTKIVKFLWTNFLTNLSWKTIANPDQLQSYLEMSAYLLFGTFCRYPRDHQAQRQIQRREGCACPASIYELQHWGSNKPSHTDHNHTSKRPLQSRAKLCRAATVLQKLTE